jgi:glycosyltransferase involved in cell wall biosynthesis
VIVHQVLSGAGPFDAVTRQALAWRARFRAWGWGGRDVAAAIDPRMNGAVAPLAALGGAHGAALLVHYSAHAPGLAAVVAGSERVLLLSHNVTPPAWLWEHDALAAVQCALGRAELPALAARARLAAGVSAYNAGEIGAQRVLPPLVDPTGWGPPAGDGDPAGPPTVLFVGRLAPHKRHDALIRAFALLRARHAPDARLVLVGEPINEAFGARVAALGAAAGGVTIERGLDERALAERYRGAHALVCLSEHEGFCLPLLEAFHFGLPIVARPSGAVAEVAGDAALLVADREHGVVAELAWLAMTDSELRAELRARGRERLVEYAPAEAHARMRAAIEEVAA